MKTEIPIRQLLNSFYNGETTVEEEQFLLDYFENSQLSEELRKEKELFLRLYQTEEVDVPAGLESKLSNLIDALSKGETKQPARKRVPLWVWIGSAAACAILMISVGLHVHTGNKEKENLARQAPHKDTFTDPEQAYAEAEKALLLFCTNYNRGIEKLSIVANSMEKTNKILEKTFK